MSRAPAADIQPEHSCMPVPRGAGEFLNASEKLKQICRAADEVCRWYQTQEVARVDPLQRHFF